MDTITTAVRPAVKPPGRRQAGALPTANEDFVRRLRRELRLMSAPRHRAPGPASIGDLTESEAVDWVGAVR